MTTETEIRTLTRIIEWGDLLREIALDASVLILLVVSGDRPFWGIALEFISPPGISPERLDELIRLGHLKIYASSSPPDTDPSRQFRAILAAPSVIVQAVPELNLIH